MQAAAGAGTAPGAAGGGGGGMPDMSAMLSNPETMKQAVSMMRGMSEDDLAIMMKSTRPGMDDTTARKCASACFSLLVCAGCMSSAVAFHIMKSLRLLSIAF